MASMDFSVIVKLIDRISSPVRNITTQFDHLNKRISASQRTLNAFSATGDKLARVASIASKIGAVSGVSLAGLGASATNITAKYEDLGAVLETLEGSSEKANTSLAWIKKFTKETPYELQNTATAFGRLRAYGIDPMNGTLKTLGDTSAAMGKDIMDSVEMLADAVVGENERLKEFGIRGSVIKGSKKKGTPDQIEYSYKNKAGEQKSMKVNKNDQEAIRKALMTIFDEKYTGAMEKRSKTFNGILSNLKDTMAGLQGQFMQAGAFNFLKSGLQSRLDFLTKLSESGQVEKWGQRTAQFMTVASQATGKFVGLVSSAASKLAGFVGGFDKLAAIAAGAGGLWLFGDLFKALALSISPAHIAIVGVAGALAHWQKLLPKVSKYFPEFADWLGENIPAAIDRFKSSMGLIKQILNGQADQWGWDSAKKTLVLMATMFSPNIIKKYGASAKWLKDTWAIALEDFNRRLPVLKAQAGVTFRAIGNWLDTNGEKIKTALSSVAIKALEKFGQGLEWLSTKAEDGSLSRWLDEVYAKIEPVTRNIIAFGKGIWESMKGIGKFIGKMAEFVGGWENMGKIVVGLGLVSVFSGLLGGIAAIAQITAIAASGLLWLGSVLGVNAVVGRGFAAVLGTVGRAFKLVGFAVTLAGRALMLNPIGLTITAIAGAAYLLYTNWDRVTKYFRETSWSQMVVDALNLVTDTALFPFKMAAKGVEELWKLIKPSLADTSWGQSIISAVDSVIGAFERFKAAYTAVRDWVAGGIKTTITAVQTGGASIKSGEGVLGTAKAIGDRIFGKTAPDGARASGGPVRAGGIYRVNELGPELLRMRGQTYLMADQNANVVPLRNMVNRTNDRLFGQQGRDAPTQTIPQIIDFKQRQQAAQQVKTSGLITIKIDSKEPVRVTQLQSSGMQLNVHTGQMGAVS